MIVMQKDIPLLKEYRLEKIIDYLVCIDKFSLNREGQRESIYELFKNEYNKPIETFDKAVFRGMVIPTLHYLGFLRGSGDNIKVSANGKLLVESNKINNDLKEQVSRALIYELDTSTYHFINQIQSTSDTTILEFTDNFFKEIPNISTKQQLERVNKWLSVLKQANLITLSNNDKIIVNKKNVDSIKNVVNSKNINFHTFEKRLFETYFKLNIKHAGIIEIADLRSEVSKKFLEDEKKIITEKMFDELLAVLIEKPGKYTISLGRPMGKQEKLFKFKENYFKTLHIEKDD